MATPINKEIKDFILLRFNESELKSLYFDYFPEVENHIGSGMSKTDKVRELITYCQRREMMGNLLVALEQERKTAYQKAFPRQQKIVSAPAIYKPQSRNPTQIFISYASKDVDLAQRLAKDLGQNEFDIFITPTSIRPGEKWVPAINRGLEESGIFLVLLTPNAVQSGWVQDETNTAITLANAGKARLYLLDVAPCRVPILWEQRQLLPFRNKTYQQNLQTLLAELNGDSLPVEVLQPANPAVDFITPPAKIELKAEAITVSRSERTYKRLVPDWLLAQLKLGRNIVLVFLTHYNFDWIRLLGVLAGILLIITYLGNAIFGDGGNEGSKPNRTPMPVPSEVASPAQMIAEEPTNTPSSICVLPTVNILNIPTEVLAHEEFRLAADAEGDALTYLWTTVSGTIIDPDTKITTYIAPDNVTADTIILRIDNACGSINHAIDLNIIPSTPTATADANIPPENALLGGSWQRPTDGMTMAYVPNGTFLMGSDDGDENEQPIHEVTLDAFWIDQTEVNNGKYILCMLDRVCEGPAYADDNSLNNTQQPVVGVSWFAAETYCIWAGGRLPTEAEWEYAARGSLNNTYPWGNESPNCDLLNYNYGDGSDDTSCIGSITSVGSYFPQGISWVGATDMAGNVKEWVSDWYDSDYYVNSDANNPTGPLNGEGKVARGGYWNNTDFNTRSSSRHDQFFPKFYSTSIGFRCVISGN